MPWQKLLDELTADPHGRGYSEMTDEEIAADLQVSRISRVKSAMSGDEVFQQTDKVEFAAMTDAKKQLWLAFTGRAINPGAAPNEDFVKWLFGAASATVANLAAARVETITRAQDLRLPELHAADIRRAREML